MPYAKTPREMGWHERREVPQAWWRWKRKIDFLFLFNKYKYLVHKIYTLECAVSSDDNLQFQYHPTEAIWKEDKFQLKSKAIQSKTLN